ncbi:MAG TPA: hypothetical protein VGM54_09830, partial [Chthoniobacter sp.]
MNIINNHAEDVDTKHPTANNPDAAKSTPESVLESGGDKKSKTHGFSKTVAEIKRKNGEKVGWHAAAVLRYLAHKVRAHGTTIDEKKWVRMKLDYIKSKFPYLGRSTVDDCIRRLVEVGACEMKNQNPHLKRPKYDETRSYHVSTKWRHSAEEEIRYFDSMLAAKIGVPAATIYYNFKYWTEECRKSDEPEQVELAPATIETLQAFDKSTIKRAIAILKREKMILPVDGKRCWYVKGPVDMPGSKADETGSNPDRGGSNPDKVGSKPDDDSYYSNVVDELEECSKREP